MLFSPMGCSSASLVASEIAARAVPVVLYDRHNTKLAAVSEPTMQISTELCLIIINNYAICTLHVHGPTSGHTDHIPFSKHSYALSSPQLRLNQFFLFLLINSEVI